MRCILSISAGLVALCFCTTAFAQSGEARYGACLSRLKTDPQGALDEATAWERKGGGAPADHCVALALVALKRYPEAANRLQSLAQAEEGDPHMQSDLLDQAGNAWLLAGEPGYALPMFSAALTADPDNVDTLADRARARAMHQDWAGAEADLTTALGLDPERADLFVLRASARRAQGETAGAQSDIDRALDIVPSYPEALVERGSIEFEKGDNGAARTDWQAVIARSPDSEAATTARADLAQMGTGAH